MMDFIWNRGNKKIYSPQIIIQVIKNITSKPLSLTVVTTSYINFWKYHEPFLVEKIQKISFETYKACTIGMFFGGERIFLPPKQRPKNVLVWLFTTEHHLWKHWSVLYTQWFIHNFSVYSL